MKADIVKKRQKRQKATKAAQQRLPAGVVSKSSAPVTPRTLDDELSEAREEAAAARLVWSLEQYENRRQDFDPRVESDFDKRADHVAFLFVLCSRNIASNQPEWLRRLGKCVVKIVLRDYHKAMRTSRNYQHGFWCGFLLVSCRRVIDAAPNEIARRKLAAFHEACGKVWQTIDDWKGLDDWIEQTTLFSGFARGLASGGIEEPPIKRDRARWAACLTLWEQRRKVGVLSWGDMWREFKIPMTGGTWEKFCEQLKLPGKRKSGVWRIPNKEKR